MGVSAPHGLCAFVSEPLSPFERNNDMLWATRRKRPTDDIGNRARPGKRGALGGPLESDVFQGFERNFRGQTL